MGSWGGVIFSFIAIIAGIWGLSVLGSDDAARDEIIARLGIGACSVLFLLGLYLYGFKTVPDEWDSDLRKKIDTLEARLTPKIAFTWRPNDNKYLSRIELGTEPAGRHVIVGRIAVKNISVAYSIRLQVSLINYLDEDATLPTTVDKDMIDNATKKQRPWVHARREANFNLFAVSDDGSISLGPFVGGETEPLCPGRYYLKVTASPKGMGREDALFFLETDRSGKVAYRMLTPDVSKDALVEADVVAPDCPKALREENR